jgi:hypothetical protein
MRNEIGYSVACHKGDAPLLRGCLASIRYFAPHAPICLVIDGNFDTLPFESRYGVSCLRRSDLKNEELKNWSFGYGITKLVALWESPFERAIHIDADAVIWGDIRKNLPMQEWDFVHNEPHEEITDYIQKTQYFDPEFIPEHVKNFNILANPYFNTGVFAFKSCSLNLGECIELLKLRQENIEKFGAGDQGILNIMVFRAMQQGRLGVKQAHLQSVVPALTKGELASRFQFDNGKPVSWKQASVVHWAGPKPYKTNPDVFSLPMDYFREIGMREFGLPDFVSAKVAMRADEIIHRDVPAAVLKAKKIIKRMIGRSC